MMELHSLTAKHIRVHIKNGSTPEDLMAHYSCTEAELKEHIQRLYSQGNGKRAQDILNALKANRKKPSRKSKAGADAAVATIPVTMRTLGELMDDLGIEPPPEKTLADLEEEERVLSDEVMALESQHKALAQKHHACIGNLRNLQAKLEEIKSLLQSCRDDYEEGVAEANTIADQMNEICNLRREKVVALEAVRQLIEEKKTVTLYVYADGRIEASDNPEFDFDDYGYQDLKPWLSEREECQNLRVRDIDTLARLLKIDEQAEKHLLVFVFEDEDLESAFQTIKGA
ncbi:hypothetical protein J6V85_03600 [Candidatus Saccharibacteria bacterium]|nr:hypothetical protein [Candidatus Saccharibacteria bacterium]